MIKRKRPTDRPCRWPLDVGLIVLIGARFVLLDVEVLHAVERVIDTICAALLILWMGIWVWINEPALREEERRQRRDRRAKPPGVPERTVPLTPVQERFLALQACSPEQRTDTRAQRPDPLNDD